ncbi:hypothetical protein I6G82_04845 [Lysinibacillus macroides]|nr:hypothetical protein I6G82_04845 [Lysinibacillus macroides]
MTNKYTQKRSVMVAKCNLSKIAEYQGYIYVVGGYNGKEKNNKKVVKVYNPILDIWTSTHVKLLV